MPNVSKISPKMIPLETWLILTPLQKMPKNVGDLLPQALKKFSSWIFKPLFLHFLIFNTVDRRCSIETIPTTGFEPQTPGVRSNCSTNWTTIIAHKNVFVIKSFSCLFVFFILSDLLSTVSIWFNYNPVWKYSFVLDWEGMIEFLGPNRCLLLVSEWVAFFTGNDWLTFSN